MAKFIVEIREDMNDLYACGVSNPSVEDLSLFIRVGAGECDSLFLMKHLQLNVLNELNLLYWHQQQPLLRPIFPKVV